MQRYFPVFIRRAKGRKRGAGVERETHSKGKGGITGNTNAFTGYPRPVACSALTESVAQATLPVVRAILSTERNTSSLSRSDDLSSYPLFLLVHIQ